MIAIPKSATQGLRLGVEQDVGGFDIAVDQGAGMRVVERLGDSGDQFAGLLKREPAALAKRFQIAPLDVLRHHEALAPIGPVEVIHGHDTRVFEPGQDAGFVQEGRQLPRTCDPLGLGAS